jgi:hypothetical protein
MASEPATPADAPSVAGLRAQLTLLAALHGGARLMRHRGPLGQPLPLHFTLHYDTRVGVHTVGGVAVDADAARTLFTEKLITLGTRPANPLAARELPLSELGRQAHEQAQAAQHDGDGVPLADDTLAVLHAMDGGARLHRDRHEGYTLHDGTAVTALTGHLLVALQLVVTHADRIDQWELSGTGRRWAAQRAR